MSSDVTRAIPPGQGDPSPRPSRPEGAPPPLRQLLRAPLAVAAILIGGHAVYHLPLVVAGAHWPVLLQPSLELLAALALLVAVAGDRYAREAARLLVTAGLTLLWLLRALDAFVLLSFGRAFTFYLDAEYARDLLDFVDRATVRGAGVAAVVVLVLVLAGACYGLWRALRTLQRNATRPLGARVFAAVAVGGVLIWTAVALAIGNDPRAAFAPSAVPRLVTEVRGVTEREARAEEQSAELASAAASAATITKPLDRLDVNVLLFIVESYGYTAYSNPDHFALLEPDLQRIEASLTTAGYDIVSHFLDSPAFGGNSWLADATLATGVRITDQEMYDRLLESDVPTLAHFFADVGYQTVNAQPANTSAWPEGDYFGFQRKYYYRDYGFRGPNLRWAPMTDQFAIDFIHRNEVAAVDGPLFVQYVLISSHYPFTHIPRYFEDWDQLGDGSIYHREDSVVRVEREPGGETGAALGYTMALQYVLRVIEQYLVRFIGDESLVVIVGDHQPWSGISGARAARSAPIHVVSRRPELLQPFARRGYTAGLIPRQPLPHPGMESFARGLLEDFSSSAAPLRTTIDAERDNGPSAEPASQLQP